MADEEKKPVTSERCRECWYRGWLDTHATAGVICCDYFLVEGELRGCPPGDECTRFRPGKRPPNLILHKYRNFELPQ